MYKGTNINLKKFFNNCKFIFKIFQIFITEYFCYLSTYSNYSRFIKNVSIRLAKENILFVKVFQAIALNNNLIDENINKELLEFTDSVPYSEEDIDILLLQEIQNKYELNFDILKPINSGMISLVYKATNWHNPQVVSIIKVKRLKIDESLSNSIEKFTFINNTLSYLPFFSKMNIPKVVDKILKGMVQQLNFIEEVKNTEDMRETCKHLDYVKIPNVNKYATHSYPNIIIMEFIEGQHISQIEQEDYKIYAKQVLKYGFVSAFMGGITHGDMHAGNILFIKHPEYKIAPIDFGLVTRLEKEKLKETMIDIAFDLFSSTPEECAEKMIDVFLEPSNLKARIHTYFYNDLVFIISDILRETIHSKNSSDQIRIYDFFKKFNELLSTKEFKMYKIEINDDFMKLQNAISMANGISITLCENDYITVVNDALNEIFHTKLFL